MTPVSSSIEPRAQETIIVRVNDRLGGEWVVCGLGMTILEIFHLK